MRSGDLICPRPLILLINPPLALLLTLTLTLPLRQRPPLIVLCAIISKFMVQSEVHSQATIKSLPLEVDFMIIEWLPLKDALNLAKALKLPEQVAVQYFACDSSDISDICYADFYDLQPSSFKFLLKTKSFQIEATSDQKTWAAIRTLDLDFVKKYIEQVKSDLNEALFAAAYCGFTDAVKLLLSDAQVDPSAHNNYALRVAAKEGHLEIVKLLLSDDRVDPSAQSNKALIVASQKGHLEIVKLLLSDDRVDPSVDTIYLVWKMFKVS
jgi:ankyrin repeat protein